MSSELYILGWTLVLAIVQILLPAGLRSQQTGLKWNAGPRDTPPPPPSRVCGRLQRAQANLYETLPLFAAAVLIAHVAGRESLLTLWGAALFLVARVVYVPLYAMGAPVVRSLAWVASVFGLALILFAILRPA
jgi:uncharacterized MAPEG superfamily protein